MSKQLARTVVNSFNMQAALLSPAHAEIIVDSIQSLAQANAKEENEQAKGSANELVAAYGYAGSPIEKPFAYADGIAFISISGVLINRFNSSWGFVTGYNFIRNQLNAALEDTDVKGIVFDVNSGGGQVAGCFELASDIYNSRAIKPSIAVVDAFAYSAAYALASSATKVLVTPSGSVGSIGAVMMHMDWSQYMKEEGIKVTFIYSGDHKKDGNPYETLPESVRADMQASVDIARKEFVDLVSRNRSLDSQAVHETQAKCYRASDAIQLGLIDGIATPTDAVISFLVELDGSVTIEKEIDMSKATNQPGTESETTVTPANAATTTTEATVDTQAKDHRQAERTRIQGILGSDAAKDKQTLANHLAMNTELSVDEAKGILAAANTEVKPQPAANVNQLEVAMAVTTNPEVGADGGNSGVQVEQSATARILAAQALATGETVGK